MRNPQVAAEREYPLSGALAGSRRPGVPAAQVPAAPNARGKHGAVSKVRDVLGEIWPHI